MELETHDIEDHAWNAGKSSSEDQQHHNIAMDRPRRTIKPLIRLCFEDLVSYALITSSRDPITFQYAVKRKVDGWVLWWRRFNLCIRTRHGIWWSFQRGREQYDANGRTRRKNQFQKKKVKSSKLI